MKYLLVLFALFISWSTEACRPNLANFKDTIENSTEVYYGTVTGVRNLSLEQNLDREKNARPIDDDEIIISTIENMEMRIFIEKVIIGEDKAFLKASGPFCGFSYDIGEEVYVFKSTNRDRPFTLSVESLESIAPNYLSKLKGKSK